MRAIVLLIAEQTVAVGTPMNLIKAHQLQHCLCGFTAIGSLCRRPVDRLTPANHALKQSVTR
ncbi:hypothetical protein IFO70_38475 [Phormidium tenue FACHB-886]|nr:hypothetical protein [Phormidium tenue FACHB-886]